MQRLAGDQHPAARQYSSYSGVAERSLKQQGENAVAPVDQLTKFRNVSQMPVANETAQVGPCKIMLAKGEPTVAETPNLS